MPSRRAFVGALLAAGVGGASLTDAREYLDRFAPLSGDVWGAATAGDQASVATPYGRATARYDNAGVPTVRGDNEAALYFAVGYVHAADRLFQMDLIRRRMRGTLSAAVGDETVESDRFHAKMDFIGAARASWRAVQDTPTGDALRAYVAGVEAARTSEPRPLEFRLLGYDADPWTPVDAMLVEKQIAWGLTGDFSGLHRAAVAEAFDERTARALYPNRMDHTVPILQGEDQSGSTDAAAIPLDRGTTAGDLSALSGWLGQFESPPGTGSNSWLVAGQHTESGRPLLANDPHLTLMAPPVWYQMHHRRPGMAVGGVTFPGTPFVVIGQNDAGAWGFTNVGADVLDVYTYDIDGGEYRYGEEWRAFDDESRTIEVAGGDDRDVTVRKTVHGPVVERAGRRVGVAWTGFQASRTSIAVHALNRSGGREEAVAALELFDSPTQNVVYADRDGNTCYWVAGLIPRRYPRGEPPADRSRGEGTPEPVRGDRVFDGSAREAEWPGYEPYGIPDRERGWIPFDEKPHVLDPDYLATANQRVRDGGEYLGTAFSAPFRARRLDTLLDRRAAADAPFDVGYMRAVQLDTYDERAPLIVPDVLDARPAMVERARNLADELAEWDYRMDRDSRGALVFALFVGHYRRVVFGDPFDQVGLDAPTPTDWVLLGLEPDDPWFAGGSGETTVGPPPDRATAIASAMEAVAAEIDEAAFETYGDYNRTALDHPFDLSFLNYPRLPTDGSPATVRNFRTEAGRGTSMRLLARFDDAGDSLTILPGGNDGGYFSDHYADQLRAWADGDYRPLAATTEGEPAIQFQPRGNASGSGGGDNND
jgi:penicillin amidase